MLVLLGHFEKCNISYKKMYAGNRDSYFIWLEIRMFYMLIDLKHNKYFFISETSQFTFL